ncbi:iron-regulated protein [Flavobacteriaceae bacterium UJ101]|nr:iron-regulated protein [Flavobacteriaceae bacterium UJ101]
MKNLNFRNITLGLASTILLFSCSNNDDSSSTTPSTNYSSELTNISLNVITATYKDLDDQAATLKTAVDNFTIGDEASLEAIKTAWRATRSPWEKSEGFLYGPVDTEGLDPALDSWPVDVTAINAILSSDNTITSTLLATNNEARGFHTIEYFIWGLDGNKTASELTARDIEYLKAATDDLKNNTQTLYDGWNTSSGNFASNFINAGQSGSLYTSQKGALEEIVDGLITIADEVGNGKIETPLNGNGGSAQPEAEESRFSHNSKADFADNIRSIQNVYLGDFGSVSGSGLTDIIVDQNATLDATIKSQITDAITAIESIPGTFTDAITNNRTAVQNAQEKVRTLQTTLESQLKPLISNL